MTKRRTTEEFVEKAKSVHGDRYNYSMVEYVNNNTKVQIECTEHGPFHIRPHDHITGQQGCRLCGIDKRTQALRSNTARFIGNARRVHGQLYDYSRATYTHALSCLTIVCPRHGEFEQTPANHCYGQGCPKCSARISNPSQQWLDSLGLPNTPEYREVTRLIPGSKYIADGYDPETRTVYEFHGDYWHGNPKRFAADDVNHLCHLTFGELYSRTCKKRQSFLDAGFNYVEIWESDWNQIKGQSGPV